MAKVLGEGKFIYTDTHDVEPDGPPAEIFAFKPKVTEELSGLIAQTENDQRLLTAYLDMSKQVKDLEENGDPNFQLPHLEQLKESFREQMSLEAQRRLSEQAKRAQALLEQDSDKDELIEAAVKAMYDRYDLLAHAEYIGLSDAERDEAKTHEEQCLSVLSEDEKREAKARFEKKINGSK